MSRIANALKRQLTTRTTQPTGGTREGLAVTNAVASGVEFFGVIAIFMGIGWVIYRASGQIWIFVALTIFGTFTTLVKMYYQAKAASDRLLDHMDLGQRRPSNIQTQGLGGVLEADLDIPQEISELLSGSESGNVEAANLKDRYHGDQ